MGYDENINIPLRTYVYVFEYGFHESVILGYNCQCRRTVALIYINGHKLHKYKFG